MKSSDSIAALSAALVQAQAEYGTAKKTATNPHLRNKYATLADVVDAVKATNAKHGLAIVQGVTLSDADGFALATRLVHQSGEWIESESYTRCDMSNQQKVGSAITYQRRYGLASMLGIVADDDDDGNASSGVSQPKAEPKAAQAKAVAEVGTDVLPGGTHKGKRLADLTLAELKVAAKEAEKNKAWSAKIGAEVAKRAGVPQDVIDDTEPTVKT